jgi:hypothetical protein
MLDWSDVSVATSYGVQLSTDSSFVPLIINISGLTQSQYLITGPLSYNTKYYWRANAANSQGSSPWSSACSFTTTDGLPNQVNLFSPANNSIDQSVNITFIWYEANESTTSLRKDNGRN